MNQRVGMAGRRKESYLSELRLDGAGDDIRSVGDHAESALEIRLSVEPQDIHAHRWQPLNSRLARFTPMTADREACAAHEC